MKINIIQSILYLAVSTSAFTTTITTTTTSSTKSFVVLNAQSDRRSFLFKTTAATAFATTLSTLSIPKNALADVSDGNALPQGAAQFARIIRTKENLITVMDRVRNHADEIDAKEWENISTFLRKVYNAGDDMKVTSKSMPDYKKKSAEGIIKDLQKYAQAGDIPAQNKNAKDFLAVSEKMLKLMNDFFDLLSDVPDEI